MAPLIEVEHLRKCFGAVVAVDDVSLHVESGEVLGFLGPNGAGKSTTLRILAGSLNASSGVARICGADVRDNSLAARTQLGYLPEGSPLYGDMTPEDFLAFVARVRGLPPARAKRRVGEVIERLELAEVLHRPIDTLSKGFRRRLGLAQALVHDPRVLILDEPTDGLDPIQKDVVRKLLRELSRDKAILLSTHLLEEVDSVCHRAILIAQGRIVGGGTPEALRRNAHDHNAVRLRVAAGDVARATAITRGLANVKDASECDGENAGGGGQIVVTPVGGAFIADAVAGALREAGVEVRSLDVVSGKLDDVFYRLTRGPEGARPWL